MKNIKKLLENTDKDYIFISFEENGVQMLTTFDPDELQHMLSSVADAIDKAEQINVYNRNTH